MEHICPKIEKCTIFTNNVIIIENALQAYKTWYCKAGEAKYKTCKRYIVSNALGGCPPSLMPNSSKSVDEIKANMPA
jgi:hypothetical protein